MHDVTSEESPASRAVADRLAHLTQVFGRFKVSVHNATVADGDWSGNHLLLQILTRGPMRSSELAQYIHADPSTISRQVANLVRDGLLERRADPNDGRAILLHPTEAGRERQQAHLARRDVHYERMLAGWTTQEQKTFADLLARFTDSFESYKATLLADITDVSARHRIERSAQLASSSTDTRHRPEGIE